ncbi:RNB domain-containing ribonuclease, partial [Acetobacter persici]|uniref:RNB domain-containing ribonuclease n=1 Tax=Acetobacter persici TaxID=1076596 RepID=UPI001BAC4191|nr:RNB domain-containing ribonuclease [Acetobacter persici]
MQKRSGAAALPDPAALRTFLEADRTPVSPPDILRAFGLPAHLKAALRTHLHAMAVAGDLVLLPPGRLKGVTGLPETARAIVTRMGRAGLPLAHLPDDPAGSTVALVSTHLDGHLILPGDALILRLRPAAGRSRREGRPIRLLSTAPRQIAAVFRTAPDRLIPCDRRLTFGLDITPDAAAPHAMADDVVLADLLPTQDGQPPQARIRTVLGPVTARGMPATLSLLTHNIPTEFSAEAAQEALRVAQHPAEHEASDASCAVAGMTAPVRRTDLRSLPVVTIDDATAQDFDDAIWAEQTPNGFRLIIAIADVAHYVAPGSALDAEARLRGNSVYLPGRVVPMLPPALSAGICSLKPGEDRLCLFADLQITPAGQIRTGTLGRGLMRSAARLTYQDVQQVLENHTATPDQPAAPAEPHSGLACGQAAAG